MHPGRRVTVALPGLRTCGMRREVREVRREVRHSPLRSQTLTFRRLKRSQTLTFRRGQFRVKSQTLTFDVVKQKSDTHLSTVVVFQSCASGSNVSLAEQPIATGMTGVCHWSAGTHWAAAAGRTTISGQRGRVVLRGDARARQARESSSDACQCT